jgi:hypothetical protein
MGAWGIQPFEDDETADWLGDLIDATPLPFLKECLDLEGIYYLEYMHCAGVLGSAVMIDGVLHGSKGNLPEEAVEWIDEHKKLKVAPLVPAGIEGLNRLLGEDAELHELWRENEELYPQWKKLMLDLKARLQKSRRRDNEKKSETKTPKSKTAKAKKPKSKNR